MRIFALADLHLSESCDKPMDKFGPRWHRHNLRIHEEWQANVTDEDWILVPGDISWGMRLDESLADLAFIHDLPGKKLFLKGNHDYWWQSLNKVKKTVAKEGLHSLHFLQHTALNLGESFTVCGTRLWLLPDDQRFTAKDEKILLREQSRLKLSLEAAKKIRGERELLFMSHYPPLNKKLEATSISQSLNEHGVSKAIFGHIHNADSPYCISDYILDGISYNLVAADYLQFKPLLIAEE